MAMYLVGAYCYNMDIKLVGSLWLLCMCITNSIIMYFLYYGSYNTVCLIGEIVNIDTNINNKKWFIIGISIIKDIYPCIIGWFVIKNFDLIARNNQTTWEISFSFLFWCNSVILHLFNYVYGCRGMYYKQKWTGPMTPIIGSIMGCQINASDVAKYKIFRNYMKPCATFIEYIPQTICVSIYIGNHVDQIGPHEITCIILSIMLLLDYMLELVHQTYLLSKQSKDKITSMCMTLPVPLELP